MAVLNGVLRLVGQYRPLLFFGVPGMLLLLFGLIWGWMEVVIYRQSQQLAVGFAMLSVLFAMLGGVCGVVPWCISGGSLLHKE